MFLIAFHRMTANHSWATCRESKDSAWISYTKVCGIHIKLANKIRASQKHTFSTWEFPESESFGSCVKVEIPPRC